MGAGKTTVGARLAARLGWPLRDSDADLLAATGRTARELDAERGTVELHRLEARHLVDGVAAPGPSVIATAASTIDDPDARTALGGEDLLVVWLRGDPTSLAARTPRGGHRRTLGADPVAGLAAQAATRYPRFAALEPFIVDVDTRSPDEVSAAIATLLGAAAR